MPLIIHTHSQTEYLAEHLAQHFKQKPLEDPFSPEWLLIPHAGIKAWLNNFLTQKLGIWSHAKFHYPRVALWKLAAYINPSIPSQPALQAQEIAWYILQNTTKWLDNPEFHLVKHYFKNQDTATMRWQWARTVAELLDLYSIYRPDWLNAWSKGQQISKNPHELWQSGIWYDICHQGPLLDGVPAIRSHRLNLKEQLVSQLKNAPSKVPTNKLPKRISLFGIHSLPEFYLEILEAFSEHLEVTLWNTRVEYPINSARKDSATKIFSLNGKVQQYFDTQLSNLNVNWCPTPEKQRSFLEQLTIQIHDCHSPQRELEILHDELLRAFDSLPDLKADQIGVMIPDLETYTPLIQAIFGYHNAERKATKSFLPYQIVASQLGDNPSVRAFQSILDLANGRWTLPGLLSVLEQPVVYQAFYLNAEDIKRCSEWLNAVSIRWGRDSAQRKSLKLPALAANTWKKGLQRLILGYAGIFERPIDGLLAYPEIEGSASRVLGHLLDFVDALDKSLRMLERSHPLEEWPEILVAISNRFLRPQQSEQEDLIKLQDDLNTLLEQSIQDEGLYPEQVSLNLIRPLLDAFWSGPNDRMIITGSIAFSTPASLRGIPFRMLCILGLNTDVWPRPSQENEINLMQSYPREGDFNVQNEDRDCFLEALINTKETLFLSYQGRRIKDNKTVPPSILVSELIEQFELPVIKHPLHPYDSIYFTNQTMPTHPQRSYNQQALHTAKVHQKGLSNPRHPPHFIEHPLHVAPPKRVPWQNIQTFYKHPSRGFLRQSLGLSLSYEEEELKESENFKLNALDAFVIKQAYLEHGLNHQSETDFITMLKASDRLPPGPEGERNLEKIVFELSPLVQVISSWNLESQDINFQMSLAETEIYGSLINTYRQGLIQLQPARIKARDTLSAWLQFLILNQLHQEQQEIPQNIFWIGLEKQTNQAQILHFKPLNKEISATSELEKYIHLFHQGHRSPLLFAPETSWILFESSVKSLDKTEDKARQSWLGGTHLRGEHADLDYQQCLSEQWYLDPEALKIAEMIYAPLAAHMVLTPLNEFREIKPHADT